MSEVTVPDFLDASSYDFSSGNWGLTGGEDVNWCTGFWNELVGENSPSLYPESPIFSSKNYDWNDPTFAENVFICPDVEEIFAGEQLGAQYPSFDGASHEIITDEDILYSVYPAANFCDIVASQTQKTTANKASKQSRKRPRKQKVESENGTAAKRRSTGCARKTKS